MKWISQTVQRLQRFANRPWYPALVGLLAALDNLILVIPNDGILISSSILTPRRWLELTLWTSLGSALGALLLCLIVQTFGMDLILSFFPHVQESASWLWTVKFFDLYGLWLVFFVAVTPIAQQPAVILATLSGLPLPSLLITIFIGRFIKFMIMSWVASHAPKLLKKMWGVRSEMKDVGLKTD